MTLASFDDAINLRQNKTLNVRSQERLIGGKKSALTITQQIPQHHQSPIEIQSLPFLRKPQLQQTFSQPQLGQNQMLADLQVAEKQKRNVMKTQATQTEVYAGSKVQLPHALLLSPRTMHRVSFSYILKKNIEITVAIKKIVI